MVVVSNQPRAVAFGGAALLHGVAWRGRERHVTHGADGRCGSSVVAVEADAGAVDQVAQRRPRVQVPAWRAALLAARSVASQIMGVSKLAKTEMWSGHPLLRGKGRCRVPRRMELGVESVSHPRDPG
jgi:hypothetical protein